jgi:hypothetical protein
MNLFTSLLSNNNQEEEEEEEEKVKKGKSFDFFCCFHAKYPPSHPETILIFRRA